MSSIDRLAFPVLDLLFPTLDEEREMKPGDAFTQEVQMRLPSPLTIAGLDKTAVRLTRRYTLREVQGQEATFDVAVIYAVDPATPPTAPRTTCVITGGGTGKATFDLGQGVFVRAEQQTHLVIDVEAPLRRLPDQAPDVDPGTGKSHLTIFLNVSGKQKVAQLFESPPQADAPSGPEASPQPAPQGGAGPE
jgi:hypothetical protein